MKLIEALPKNNNEQIVLNPGGLYENKPIAGEVELEWFNIHYKELFNSELPLRDEQFNKLRDIDDFWKQNAERWRNEGLI